MRRAGFPLMAFLVVGLALAFDVWLSASALGVIDTWQPEVSFPGSGFLGGWFHFDGWWYLSIVTEGYSYSGPDIQSSVAFLPGYPLAIAATRLIVRDPVLAGMAVTFASGLAATYLFHRWTAEKLGGAAARMAVLALLLYPFSFFLFGTVYPQAFFLFVTLLAFVLLERDHPVLAGMVGAVAVATRPEGVAVVVGLVCVTLYRRSKAGQALRTADAGVLISVGGLVAWSGYLWSRFGSPLAWVEVQRAWHADPGPSTWLKFGFFDRLGQAPGWVSDAVAGSITSDPDPMARLQYLSTLMLQGALALGALLLAVVVFRKLGWGYGIYASTVLLVPLLGSDDFHGIGRFALAAFPCFAVAGDLLSRNRVARWTFLPLSGALLLFVTSAYARGHFVA